MSTPNSQLRLWQLISPALPVGAYAYSAGLEYAVDCGWIENEQAAQEWICGQLQHNLCTLDIPVLSRLYHAWQNQDIDDIHYWNRFLLASRESSELRTEDVHLGAALSQLLPQLEIKEALDWQTPQQCSYANMFTLAAARWEIPLVDTAQGYLWAWAENQVAAAIKLIPLGQTAGQRIMSCLSEYIPTAVDKGLTLEDNDVGAMAPAVAMASAKHETQYSRLFRS